MKKLSYYLVSLLLAGLLFTACSDDDEPVSIEGTWVVQSQELEVSINGVAISNDLLATLGVDTDVLEIPEGSTLELAPGGQLTASQPGQPSTTGTWSLSADGKTLTTTQGGQSVAFEVLELTQQTLNLKVSQTEQTEQDGVPIEVTIELAIFGTRQ